MVLGKLDVCMKRMQTDPHLSPCTKLSSKEVLQPWLMLSENKTLIDRLRWDPLDQGLFITSGEVISGL